jgi:hypothetical protein
VIDHRFKDGEVEDVGGSLVASSVTNVNGQLDSTQAVDPAPVTSANNEAEKG